MHDEAAHPSQPFSSPVKQLGDFFKQSVKEWVKAINSGGFISLQARNYALLAISLTFLCDRFPTGLTGVGLKGLAVVPFLHSDLIFHP